MKIDYLGHACFKVSGENYSIVFDPYEDGAVPGLEPVREEASMVLCSHDHHDHNAKANIKEIKGSENVKVSAVPSFHDHHEGAHRGTNVIHIIEAEGLRIAHFGDLGHIPSEEQLEILKNLDVAMIPVGGHFTIDTEEAAHIVNLIKPRIAIPMHYRTENAGYEVIGTVDAFTAHFDSGIVKFCTKSLDPADKNGICVLNMLQLSQIG